jgi:hypothetical protein
MNRHTVTAYRDERQWNLRALSVPGAITRGASLDDAEVAMRTLLAALTGKEADSFAIDLVPLPGPGGYD